MCVCACACVCVRVRVCVCSIVLAGCKAKQVILDCHSGYWGMILEGEPVPLASWSNSHLVDSQIPGQTQLAERTHR